MPPNLDYVVLLHQKPAQTLALCKSLHPRSPITTSSSDTRLLSKVFSFQSDTLVYRRYSCIPSFGSFPTRFLLYARASLVVPSAPRCSRSDCSSSFCFSVLFAFVDVSVPRCLVLPARLDSRATYIFAYRLCTQLWHKLKRAARKTIATATRSSPNVVHTTFDLIGRNSSYTLTSRFVF